MAKGAVRIAGCAGGNTDRWTSLADFAKDPNIHGITGDWMSESNMVSSAAIKIKTKTTSEADFDQTQEPAYACEFLQSLEPAIPDLARNRAKLVVNAGAADTERLARECDNLIRQHNIVLKIAWVDGDDVTCILREQIANGKDEPFALSVQHRQAFQTDSLFAQCYLGGWGIVEALNKGADIVICGRVSDASPTVGIAAWWHTWCQTDFDCLARALIAGHVIECSGYGTGGNFTGFKKLLQASKHYSLGFPIAEIDSNGTFNITKEQDKGGCVNILALTSQLVYEIQGPWYLNSDVTADISEAAMEQIDEDVVRVTGIKGMPPPPSTKVGITVPGGYQAEFHAFMTGLDIEEKCRWTEDQIRYAIGDSIRRFSVLSFQRIGSPASDAVCQDHATVLFRVFAQTDDPELLRNDTPNSLYRWCMSTFLQSCPALTPTNDPRTATAKPYNNYYTTFMPQSSLSHRVCYLFSDLPSSIIPAPSITQMYSLQPSYDSSNPADLSSFGPAARVPLGSIVYGRSCSSNADHV